MQDQENVNPSGGNKAYSAELTSLIAFLVLLAFLGVQFISYATVITIDEAFKNFTLPVDATSVSLMASAIAGTLVILFFLGMWKFNIREYLALKSFSISQLLLWTIIYMGFLGILYLLRGYFQEEIDFVQQLVDSARFLPLLFFAIVIAGPFFEEALLRGFVFKGLKNTVLGVSGTIIVTSLIFSVLHVVQYEFLFLIPIFFGGVILGMARHYSGSLWVPFILHAIHNFTSIVYLM